MKLNIYMDWINIMNDVLCINPTFANELVNVSLLSSYKYN